jgi:hypothetical protein
VTYTTTLANCRLFFLIAICVPATAFADAAATLLIHQALGKELSGRRRGNIELMASAYDEKRFVVYDGGGRVDPVGWKVVHESASEYARALEEDLRASKYDIQRTYLLVNVLEGRAFVAVVDSGSVIDPATGAASQYWVNVLEGRAFVAVVDSGSVIDPATGAASQYWVNDLWFFEKRDEEWFATGFVHDIGDSTAGRFAGDVAVDRELAEFLEEEAQEWRDGSAGSLSGFYDDRITVVDAYGLVTPASWIIVFSGEKVWKEWLDNRLELTTYDLEREVVHTSMGASGTEALAVAHEKVTVGHTLGDANHSADRHVMWTLSKRGGSWRVTNLFWHLRRPN